MADNDGSFGIDAFEGADLPFIIVNRGERVLPIRCIDL